MRARRIGSPGRCARFGWETGEAKTRRLENSRRNWWLAFVMGFAAWLLQRAQENGVKRLYFMSRDCQLVGKVAGTARPAVHGGIECRYLYVSRQALFLPSAKRKRPV